MRNITKRLRISIDGAGYENDSAAVETANKKADAPSDVVALIADPVNNTNTHTIDSMFVNNSPSNNAVVETPVSTTNTTEKSKSSTSEKAIAVSKSSAIKKALVAEKPAVIEPAVIKKSDLTEKSASNKLSNKKLAAAEKAAAEKAAAEKAAADKIAAEKAAAEKAAADRAAAAEQALVEKLAAEKIIADKKAAEERAEAERIAAEKAAAEKAAAERAAAAEQALIEKIAAQKAAAKAAAERAAAERAAAEKALADRLAAARAAAQEEADRAAMAQVLAQEAVDKAIAEKEAADRRLAEKLAAARDLANKITTAQDLDDFIAANKIIIDRVMSDKSKQTVNWNNKKILTPVNDFVNMLSADELTATSKNWIKEASKNNMKVGAPFSKAVKEVEEVFSGGMHAIAESAIAAGEYLELDTCNIAVGGAIAGAITSLDSNPEKTSVHVLLVAGSSSFMTNKGTDTTAVKVASTATAAVLIESLWAIADIRRSFKNDKALATDTIAMIIHFFASSYPDSIVTTNGAAIDGMLGYVLMTMVCRGELPKLILESFKDMVK